MNERLTSTRLMGLCVVLTALAVSEEAAAGQGVKLETAAVQGVRVVNCNNRKTITDALRIAQPGDTIVVKGTCHEKVTVTTDRITFDGRGTATIDGGGGPQTEFDAVVNVDGVQGVIIKGLTIQNGSGEGIRGAHGAAFAVRQTVVQNNSSTGIAIHESSTAELSDCSIRHNLAGMDVFTGSSAVLKGTIDNTDNLQGGFVINGTSIVEVRGASVQASRNGTFGLTAGSNSQLAFFEFAGASNMLTVDANVQGGIALGDSVLNLFSTANTTISVTNNPVGIIVRPGSIVSPNGVGTFVIENNDVGLDFRLGGTAIFRGGLTVRNNRIGVATEHGAGVLWFISIPPNPSAITGNGLDVDLRFGARATFDGVAVGSITCDATVLSRGTTVCP